MCGICGFVNLSREPAERTIIERMNRALAHRGPDGTGTFIDGPIALAMRRLAIIDLESGHQPMSNEDGTVWIVFNGEIYNSPKLTSQLRAIGHRFATRNSDTEAVVHLYEESGTNCTDQLRGMFAFAIYDRRRNEQPTLLLARDRLGVKPLYYYFDDHLLAFSSELTSLVQHPNIERRIEPVALHQYLATGTVAAPLSMFRNVRQLLPGQRMILKGKRILVETYWQPQSTPLARVQSLHDVTAQIRYRLERAVSEHLLSDVPVGAFLSGGIDSSTVVALMALASSNRIPTFSIRFEETNHDESRYARLVAAHYQTDHHEFTVPNKGFDFHLLQAMITHHGQPTADTSAIPTFLVSRLARDHVKVVLSGDGGDECFAGYSHYGWSKRIDRLYNYPYRLRQKAHHTLQTMARWPVLSQNNYLRQVINAIGASLAKRNMVPLEVLRLNGKTEINNLLESDWHLNGGLQYSDLNQILRGDDELDVIRKCQLFSFRYFLPDAYLAKVDRMSMANALEVRVPFLDHRLVEYALSLPGTMHWQHGVGKQLLRRAVADLLPDGILAHRKQGFSIPLYRWANSSYFELAEELLSENAVRSRGIFNPSAVRHLLDRCQGRGPHRRSLESDYRLSHRLFMLICLEIWCRQYLDDLVQQPTETSRWFSHVRETSYE